MDTRILLEEAASRKEYMAGVVSFWDTTEWTQIKEEFNLVETTTNQGGLWWQSHEAHHLRRRSCPERSVSKTTWRSRSRTSGTQRSCPVMTMVASALVVHFEVAIKNLSWDEHIQNNQTP